ncbi:MAG: chemotaxis protein CheW [Acidobacteriota bacterium]
MTAAAGGTPLADVGFVRTYRVCRLGPLFYAIDSATVRAVMFAHRGLEGEVPLHGERFPVLEPRALLELPPTRDDACQAVLVGGSKPVAALLVDAVEERTVDVDTRRFQDLPWHFSGRERLWFDGVASAGDQVLIRLHTEGLLVSYRAQRSLEAEGLAP